jgi:hypothetical protein
MLRVSNFAPPPQAQRSNSQRDGATIPIESREYLGRLIRVVYDQCNLPNKEAVLEQIIHSLEVLQMNTNDDLYLSTIHEGREGKLNTYFHLMDKRNKMRSWFTSIISEALDPTPGTLIDIKNDLERMTKVAHDLGQKRSPLSNKVLNAPRRYTKLGEVLDLPNHSL